MDTLKKFLLATRLIGWANLARAVVYSLRRDRLEARHPASAPGPAVPPGRLVSAEPRPGGARFQFERSSLEVRFLLPDLAFLGWDGAGMEPSYAVEAGHWPEPEPVLLQQTKQGTWRLRNSALELRLAADGGLTWLEAGGRVVRRERPPERTGAGWRQRVELDPGAGIYGLGERAGRLDLRPGSYRFWNRDAGGVYGPGTDPLYITMPVYLCLQEGAGSLAFYDNSFDGRLDLGEAAEIDFEGGPARQYLAFGSPAVLLERFTRLTGRPPLPPRWALGYQQSRWGYRDEADLRRVFAEFQRLQLPLSALVADIDLQPGFRTLTVDQARFPDLKGLADEMSAAGVRLVAILDPGVKIDPQFDLYREGLDLDAYCKLPDGRPLAGVVWPGWSVFPDFTAQRVRLWWGDKYARLLGKGVAGFWNDMNEPASFTGWGEMTLPSCTRHDLDGRGGDHREAHNVYGLNMTRAGFEGLRRLDPGRRPFLLSRSGWAGMQRYAWTWTGDIATSWEVLRQTVACVLGLGLSGQPYAGPDIGGFSGVPSAELFTRWFQLGSFLPFFRTHSALGLPRREPWEFGPAVLEAVRRSLQQRYRLLPYWYTLAWQASQDGRPLTRPLFWDDPASTDLREAEDAFLLGEALLVAPVVAEGARQREVFLPSGGWYELDGHRLLAGGRAVRVQAPLERIPVFVRAGSLLPTEEQGRLVLNVYCPVEAGTGTGELYLDAGDGYGPASLSRFGLAPRPGGGWRLTWERSGEYAWPREGLALRLLGFEAARPVVDGRQLEAREGLFDVDPFGELLIAP